MDISPDSDLIPIPHSEWRGDQDGVQIFDFNDEHMQEKRENLP